MIIAKIAKEISAFSELVELTSNLVKRVYMKRVIYLVLTVGIVMASLTVLSQLLQAADVPRITKEELKGTSKNSYL